MLISKELEQAINDQIGREIGASLQYISIAAYFDADSLPQLAAFFYRQSGEERMHALKFVDYIIDAGGQVRIGAIASSRYDFKSAKDAVQAASTLKTYLLKHLGDLEGLSAEELVEQRYQRFRAMTEIEDPS